MRKAHQPTRKLWVTVGITDVYGPFLSHGHAETWCSRNQLTPNVNVRILPLEHPGAVYDPSEEEDNLRGRVN